MQSNRLNPGILTRPIDKQVQRIHSYRKPFHLGCFDAGQPSSSESRRIEVHLPVRSLLELITPHDGEH